MTFDPDTPIAAEFADIRGRIEKLEKSFEQLNAFVGDYITSHSEIHNRVDQHRRHAPGRDHLRRASIAQSVNRLRDACETLIRHFEED